MTCKCDLISLLDCINHFHNFFWRLTLLWAEFPQSAPQDPPVEVCHSSNAEECRRGQRHRDCMSRGRCSRGSYWGVKKGCKRFCRPCFYQKFLKNLWFHWGHWWFPIRKEVSCNKTTRETDWVHFLDKFGWNKEKNWLEAGPEPATSGLTCRGSNFK